MLFRVLGSLITVLDTHLEDEQIYVFLLQWVHGDITSYVHGQVTIIKHILCVASLTINLVTEYDFA